MLIRWILSTVAILITSWLLSGVHIANWMNAALLSLVLGLLNAVLRPILIVLTIPITFLTLGLFLLVINTLMVVLASRLVPGFQVDNFWWALAFSLLLSLVNALIGRKERRSE